jgi:hypothetical protein
MKAFFKILLFAAPLFCSILRAENPSSSSFNPNTKQGTQYTETSSEAGHWLNLVDQRQYGPAWLDAGPLLQDVLSQQAWVGAMHFIREPLGNVLSRTIVSNEETSALPHGTRGGFMILNYRTQFSHSRYGLETVILMRNHNNLWRVISYTVKMN